MKKKVSFREAISDPQLLAHAMPGESWAAWRIILTALMGEELTAEEREVWTELTGGREREPGEMIEEAAIVAGRRAGKSRATSLLATYVSALCDFSDRLVEGEKGVFNVLSQTRRQATVILNYSAALFAASPQLSKQVDSRTAEILRLKNGVDLEIRSASFRGVRGVSLIGVITDELAFWMLEGSGNPDTEILRAVRPALSMTGGPLLMISSPYGRAGELFAIYDRHYGRDGDARIPVIQAASRRLNPLLSQRIVDRALERDPQAARAEFLGQFRDDVQQLLPPAIVDRAISSDCSERPWAPGNSYVAFCDPAGGSGGDSMVLAIGHKERDDAIIDRLVEKRPPFSPANAVEEFCAALKEFGLRSVRGDRYASGWCSEAFAAHGVEYRLARASKSEIYAGFVTHMNSERVRLPDSDRLKTQLLSLERKTSRNGRDVIDHPKGNFHDDLANACAGVVDTLLTRGDLDTFDELLCGPEIITADGPFAPYPWRLN